MSEWLHINKIEMLVVKAEYNYELEKTLQGISISCELLNIARGRCEVNFLKCSKNILNKKLFISSKKAVMNANIDLSDQQFDNLNDTLFKYSHQKSKKIKITLLMDKAVATNSEGILSLDNDLTTDLKDVTFNIPIF
ncbi:MAG: hypothetical protein CFH34_00628 [Alphaproteobacteria bacterium MarineAlpha9_Bin4]|nr:MAG: hypothetical protein CFH34_00628 [Alphaproteobacteria bacterium MarineAlpha9_Bin4]|tara:strand:- start:423 stop:833 length:411 start_codon:yes stop_codon:yes gene_type:complete